MNLDSFIAPKGVAVKPVPVSTEPPSTVTEGDHASGVVALPTGAVGRGLAPENGAVASPPQGAASAPSVTTDTTPNGIVLEYQAKPKRLYRVNGVEVPSVTTVLDLLNKGGLTVWGQRVGIQGVLSLFDQGALTAGLDWGSDRQFVALPQGEDEIPADVPSIEALMKEHKLTTNDVKDSAADRGTNVHDALEQWAKTGHLPSPAEFDESEIGYVQGLLSFLQDANPEPVRQEVMVGSVEHGYAGRYDLELRFNETRKVRKTPKQKWHEVEAGTFLCDLKTSRSCYDTHALQLAAYELARIECGYPPTDGQAVLRVEAGGSYEFRPTTATGADFLKVLAAHSAITSKKFFS